MSKLNPHRKIVLKMSVFSADKFLMYLNYAKKYVHIFEFNCPSYENDIDNLINIIRTCVHGYDGVHQSVVDIHFND